MMAPIDPELPQSVHEEDELPLKVPAAQLEQFTASPFEYVPGLHAEHVEAAKDTPV